MRQPPDPRLPFTNNKEWPKDLTFQLTKLLRDYSTQLNGITEGQIYAFHNAATAAPTTGTYEQGDYIKNSAPSEAGSASSKYVILGWVCSVGGTPGTWLECRSLTGN